MRNTATKARRELMQAFIKSHAEEIEDINEVDGVLYRQQAWRLFIDTVVRKEIPYSDKTYWYDIALRIRREYDRIFKHQK